MKTLGASMLSAVGLAVLGFAPVAGAAPAPAAKCTGSVLVSASYVRLFGGSPVTGSIQLRRDSCYRYWGAIKMYQPMKKNTFAIAYIIRFNNGKKEKPISCDNRGGNGRVVQGQTSCYTPRVTGRPAQFRFVASGHEFQNGGGGWTRVSWGQTKRTR